MDTTQLDLIPTDEERQMRETVAAICTDMGGPRYTREKVAKGEPPTELWDALASRGYLGVNVPEEYGGSGPGMRALAAGGGGVTAAGCGLLLIVVSPAIVGSILARHGTPDQKERWLRPIGEGTIKVAFAITEPDAGSNSHNISTAATPTNGGYSISGQKTYISGVEEADGILVVVRKREKDRSLSVPML